MEKNKLKSKKWYLIVVLFIVLWIVGFILSGVFFVKYTYCDKEKNIFSHKYGLKASKKNVLNKINKHIEKQYNT